MTLNDEILCQEALALLRQEIKLTEGFSSGGESLTKIENACLRVYDYARRSFLAVHDWNFARRRASFQGVKPLDALRVTDVTDATGASVMWRIDGERIIAGADAAETVYTVDAEDVTTWPILARAAFAAFLARELCIPVSGRQEDLKAIDALSAEKMNAARLADLREGNVADDRSAEVLALLRQSAGLSGATEADGVEAATRRLPLFIKSATDEVLALHDWGATDYDSLPILAHGAVLALAAQKIAVQVGVGSEHANALYALFSTRLQNARIRHLSDGIADLGNAVQGEILSRLLGEFSADDKALAFNVSSYTRRISAVSATVLGAINDAHDWGATFEEDDLEGTLKEVYILGVCAALATTVGVPAERATAYGNLYESKLLDARVKDLHNKLAANTDPILAELVSNFSVKDAALVHLFDIYQARVSAVRTDAEAEVEAAHDWPVLETEALNGNLQALKTVAVNTRILEKLSGVVGGGEGAAQRYAKEFEMKLLAARVFALENETFDDVVAREVAAILRPMQGMRAAALPRSIGARVAELKESARKEVISAHKWNFARYSMNVVAPIDHNGESRVARPADCARIEAIRGDRGELADWSVRGDWIVAHEPIKSITYIRDVEEVDEWPSAVRRALVYRIAADIVLQGGEDRFSAMYEKKLSDAALQDAREGNPGRGAWGRSKFAAAMRGGDGYGHNRCEGGRGRW